jgi:hypothetical protein
MTTDEPYQSGTSESGSDRPSQTNQSDDLPNRMTVMLMGGVLLGAACCRPASQTRCLAAVGGLLLVYQGFTGRLSWARPAEAPVDPKNSKERPPSAAPGKGESSAVERSPERENL